MRNQSLALLVGVVAVAWTSWAYAAEEGIATKPTTAPGAYLEPTKENYMKLAADVEEMLRRDVLGAWFPMCVDKANGGFTANLTRDWQRKSGGDKFSVFQGRMTWVASEVCMRLPGQGSMFVPIAHHGVQYLRNVMWDKEYGGFYLGLDEKGQITPNFTDGKHLYGISFCIYGAVNAYRATGDPRALQLAQDAFRWVDKNAHDEKNGGYFEWLTREGKVVQPKNPNGPKDEPAPGTGFPIGYKSMNTHIHLMESFTELYAQWKDPVLGRRLEELLAIVRDKICVRPGVMNLYFTPDWRAYPDHDSYGHDVETAYLMLETAQVLEKGDDPQTHEMAKMLVDHALAYGWDEVHGGMYAEGTTFGPAETLRKDWWVQMESLNALLLMHDLYGKQTDVYFRAFQRQWQFIKDHMIDMEFGGIYTDVQADGRPGNTSKAHNWKAAYHDGRALMNVADRLRKLGK